MSQVPQQGKTAAGGSGLTVSSGGLTATGNATGSGRNKVALKPGHSLMDWIRKCKQEEDLSGVGGRKLKVTQEELACHSRESDCWIAIHGQVYNVTPYLDFHPGGREELMRAAGKEATDLFNQVHHYVNFASMLRKCFVGEYCAPAAAAAAAAPAPASSSSSS